ncbi:MAG: hypothetical protein HY920_02475 [Elusimicrobia bacterium]|nr:hypothetical protein [Elusimicrobiota bacterium]
MRKIILISISVLTVFVASFSALTVFSPGKFFHVPVPVLNAAPVGKAINPEGGKTGFKAFPVYTDRNSPDNHFIPSGWMGDYGDLRLSDRWSQNPHSGATCIQWIYSALRKQGTGWAGCFWQNPANNWGAKKGGYNLTGAKKFVFWARGEKGGEQINEVGVGGISGGEFEDTDKISAGPITLTKEWKKYEIDLTGADLSYISGGFFWATGADDNPDGGIAFYLDDMRFE